MLNNPEIYPGDIPAERDKIIKEAKESNKDFDMIVESSKFDGFAGGQKNKELVAALYCLSLDGAGEGFAGTVENGCAATQIYPYILTEDNQGFCGFVGPYNDRAMLERIMAEYSAEYGDSELSPDEVD